jgi:hypothetical protein
MEQIRVVIAELQLVLAMLAKNPPDPRVKATLEQAEKDLKEAIRSITGQQGGGGET